MRVLIHKNYENICHWTANHIMQRINSFAPSKEKPFVLGLPTGSTPLGVYKELIVANKAGKISFSKVITFNMDEYMGLQADHPQSYRKFMNDNFFNNIDIAMENTHVPNGMTKDPVSECLAYEEAIKAAGGVELFMGGIGSDGHIAFNEPGSALTSRTRMMNLTRETIIANARFFGGDTAKVPATALTVGIGTVMDAREVIIIANGAGKARAIAAAVEGAVSQWCPLSCLQMHQNAILVCDEEAAGELKYSTVQYFKDIEKLN